MTEIAGEQKALCKPCAERALGESDMPEGLKAVAWVALQFADVLAENDICGLCGETGPLIATADYADDEPEGVQP